MGLTPEKIRADQIAYGEAMSGESTRPAHDYVPPEDAPWIDPADAAVQQMRASMSSQVGGAAALEALDEKQREFQARRNREEFLMHIKDAIGHAEKVAESEFAHPLLARSQPVWISSQFHSDGGYWSQVTPLSRDETRRLAVARSAHVAKVRAAKSDIADMWRQVDRVDSILAERDATAERRAQIVERDLRTQSLIAARKAVPFTSTAAVDALGHTPVDAHVHAPEEGGQEGEIVASVDA